MVRSAEGLSFGFELRTLYGFSVVYDVLKILQTPVVRLTFNYYCTRISKRGDPVHHVSCLRGEIFLLSATLRRNVFYAHMAQGRHRETTT